MKSLHVGKEAKCKVLTFDPWCGFHISSCGLQALLIFHVVSVGSHYTFSRHRVPDSLSNLTHFSQFTPILPNFFQFITIYPNFVVFMLWATLLTPSFCSFILWATYSALVAGLSLTGNDFGTQLPPKFGSTIKNFSFGLP